MNKGLLWGLLLVIFPFCQSAKAQILLDSTTVDTSTVVGGLDIPWEIQWGPDDWIWVSERSGRISRVDPEKGNLEVLLNHESEVVQIGESGMLGFAFHPDFDNTPKLFVVYTYEEDFAVKERLVTFDFDGTALTNETVLLNEITGNTTHNGSRLLMLPDNTLLMTTGDAQTQSLPQNVNSLSGKTLRLNLDGTVPADNPIPGSLVWSWGHRNAQGLTILPNGSIYSSEHGPVTDDELNKLFSGRNYGWPNVHGFCDNALEDIFCLDSNVVEPLINWTPTIAVSDLIWYDHPAIPEFTNTLLMTTLKARKLVSLTLDASGDNITDETFFFIDKWGRLRDICTSPDGRIFLATSGDEWTNTMPFTHRIIEVVNPNYTSVETGLRAQSTWLRIQPNPASANQSWTVSDNLVGGNYQLLDYTGKIVQSGRVISGSNSFNEHQLSLGIYLLNIQKGKNIARGKLVRK